MAAFLGRDNDVSRHHLQVFLSEPGQRLGGLLEGKTEGIVLRCLQREPCKVANAALLFHVLEE